MTRFALSLDELAALAHPETPVIDIDFQCEESDAALVEIGADTAVVYYEQDLEAEVEVLVATVRVARERWNATAYRGRLAYRWTLFAAVVLAVVLVGFVFGLGLLSLSNMVVLGTAFPLGGGASREVLGRMYAMRDDTYDPRCKECGTHWDVDEETLLCDDSECNSPDE